MKDVLETLDRWVEEGSAVALATVVETKRSAPQPIGAKMAVNEDGRVVGAVSGGCVESAVVAVAEGVIADGEPPQLLEFGIADEEAWDVGLPCGGVITVWVEPYATDGAQAGFAALAREGGRGALVTALEGAPAPGAKLLVTGSGARVGSLGDPALDAGATELATDATWSEAGGRHQREGVPLFVDVVAPPPRLMIFGAVDFAKQLAALARLSGWRPFVVDPRSRFATRERFPDAEEVIAAWPAEAIEQLGEIDRATWVAVLTHDPKLDDAILEIALRSEAAYVGAMGSRRAQEKRRDRLLAKGLEEAQLERLSAPIGLDIGALSAEETAISIMAEMIAVRNGRSGGRLADHEGQIHAVPAGDPRAAARGAK